MDRPDAQTGMQADKAGGVWDIARMQGTWGRAPGRADRVSVGPVVSNSEPLSPRRTPGLACGIAAQ